MSVGSAIDCPVGEADSVLDDAPRVEEWIAALEEDDEEVADAVGDGDEHDGVDGVDLPLLDEDAEEEEAEGDLKAGGGKDVGDLGGKNDLQEKVSMSFLLMF